MLFYQPVFLSLSDPETIADTFDSIPFPACHPEFFGVLGIQLLTTPPSKSCFYHSFTFDTWAFRFQLRKSLTLMWTDISGSSLARGAL